MQDLSVALAWLREGSHGLPACACGWAMPAGVIPYRGPLVEVAQAADLEPYRVKDAGVRLHCPICGTPHGFYMPDAAAALGVSQPGAPS